MTRTPGFFRPGALALACLGLLAATGTALADPPHGKGWKRDHHRGHHGQVVVIEQPAPVMVVRPSPVYVYQPAPVYGIAPPRRDPGLSLTVTLPLP